MKKLILVFVFILFSLLGCATTQVQTQTAAQSIKPVSMVTIKRGEYNVNVEYPELIDSKSNPSAQGFNQAVMNSVNHEIAVFKTHVSGVDKQYGQNIKTDKAKTMQTENFLKMSYQVVYAGQKTIGIRFTMVSNTFASAHPLVYVSTLNYDLEKNKVLSLKDVLGKHTLNDLAQYCKYSLAKTLSKGDIIEAAIVANTSAKWSNYRNWNLVDKGVLITFDRGTVAPWGQGEVEVMYPL